MEMFNMSHSCFPLFGTFPPKMCKNLDVPTWDLSARTANERSSGAEGGSEGGLTSPVELQ